MLTMLRRVFATRAFLAVPVVLGSGGAQSSQDWSLRIENPSTLPRTECLFASVPFERGAVVAVPEMHVADHDTSWRVLQRWPDGSVRVAQAQFTRYIGPYAAQTLDLRPGTRRPAPFVLHEGISRERFAIVTVVRDVDGVPYAAVSTPFSDAMRPELLSATETAQTWRVRTYHTNPWRQGIGRDLLSLTCYFTLYSRMPCARIDVVVANDYLGADRPKSADPNEQALGDVAVDGVEVYVIGAHADLQYRARNDIQVVRDDVLEPDSTYARLLDGSSFDDGQGKRWRLNVLFDRTLSAAERTAWRTSMAAAEQGSVSVIASQASWARSAAFGVLGGPVAPPAASRELAVAEFDDWRERARFGPFGSWGDIQSTSVGGMPRMGPVEEVAAHAVQTGMWQPMLQLEAMAWQQTCRPFHLWSLRVEPDSDIYLWDPLPHSLTSTRRMSEETLGRLALQRNDPWARYRPAIQGAAHGWNGYDAEHFTLDLLFEYWTLTGDDRARDEIVNLGESALGITRPSKYFSQRTLSARTEGSIAQALVKAWFASGDDRYRRHIVERIHRIVDVQQPKDHPSRALMFQEHHPLTGWPEPTRFYMAWQHAFVAFGYFAVWEHFGDPVARAIAHDTLDAIEDSWVRDYWSEEHGFVPEGLRYATPVEHAGSRVPASVFDHVKGLGAKFDHSPLKGTAMFMVGALDLLLEDARSLDEYERVRMYLRALLAPRGPEDDRWRWGRWCFLREAAR